jgi:ribose-phosphate pyrophosphokinase
MFKSTCVFSGNSNPALAEKIAQYLELPVARARVTRFSDGEVFAEIKENVRGVDVYVIQSTCAPVNDNLMELLVMVRLPRSSPITDTRGRTERPRHGRRSRRSWWPTC